MGRSNRQAAWAVYSLPATVSLHILVLLEVDRSVNLAFCLQAVRDLC